MIEIERIEIATATMMRISISVTCSTRIHTLILAAIKLNNRSDTIQ